MKMKVRNLKAKIKNYFKKFFKSNEFYTKIREFQQNLWSRGEIFKKLFFLSPFIFVTVFVIVIITSKNEQQQEAIEEREEKSNKS